MKKLLGTDLSGSYTFNAAAKTITFSGISESLTLSNILLITNTTANTIIYNFADPSTGAVSFNNNILTLDYDTTSMNSNDVLQVYLDTPSHEESLHDLLRRIHKLLESNSVVDLQQRQRVVVDALPTTTQTVLISGGTAAVTSVSSIPATVPIPYASAGVNTGGLTASVLITEGPLDQRERVIYDARACYAQAIRSRLSFT